MDNAISQQQVTEDTPIRRYTKEEQKAIGYVRTHETNLRKLYGENYLVISSRRGIVDYDEDRAELEGRMARLGSSRGEKFVLGTIDSLLDGGKK